MKGNELRLAALSGARWTMAAKVGLQLLTWPITIIVIRLLEPSDYGLQAMAMVTIGFVALFGELGLGAALVQAKQLDDLTARTAAAAILICNVAIAGILWASAPWASLWFEEPDLDDVMRVLTLELLISSVATVPYAQLERQLRFRQLSIAAIASGVVGAVTTLALALAGCGVWSLVFGSLAAAGVRAALIIVFNGRFVWPSLRHAFRPIAELVKFGGHVLSARTLWYWYGQSDQVILGRLLHATVFGSYNVGAQLAMMPASKAMEVINRVSFPVLSRMRSEDGSLRSMHIRMVGLVAAYAVGACWAMAATAPELVVVLLGSKWHTATTALMLLGAVAPLRMLSALNNTITSAAGAPQASTTELAVASVLLPAALATGAWTGGLLGACLAWPLAYPAVYWVSNRLTCRVVGNRLAQGWLALGGPMVAGIAMWSSIVALRWQLSGVVVPVALLLVELLVGLLVFVGTLRLVSPAVAAEAWTLLLDLMRPARGKPAAAAGSAHVASR
jgi:O-antigen/teichoic acid export membrane protein